MSKTNEHMLLFVHVNIIITRRLALIRLEKLADERKDQQTRVSRPLHLCNLRVLGSNFNGLHQVRMFYIRQLKVYNLEQRIKSLSELTNQRLFSFFTAILFLEKIHVYKDNQGITFLGSL